MFNRCPDQNLCPTNIRWFVLLLFALCLGGFAAAFIAIVFLPSLALLVFPIAFLLTIPSSLFFGLTLFPLFKKLRKLNAHSASLMGIIAGGIFRLAFGHKMLFSGFSIFYMAFIGFTGSFVAYQALAWLTYEPATMAKEEKPNP